MFSWCAHTVAHCVKTISNGPPLGWAVPGTVRIICFTRAALYPAVFLWAVSCSPLFRFAIRRFSDRYSSPKYTHSCTVVSYLILNACCVWSVHSYSLCTVLKYIFFYFLVILLKKYSHHIRYIYIIFFSSGGEQRKGATLPGNGEKRGGHRRSKHDQVYPSSLGVFQGAIYVHSIGVLRVPLPIAVEAAAVAAVAAVAAATGGGACFGVVMGRHNLGKSISMRQSFYRRSQHSTKYMWLFRSGYGYT